MPLDHILRPRPDRRLPAFVQATLACHAVALGVAVAWPAWAWAAGVAVLCNHALIMAATLWPRSQWLGPNVTALPLAAAQRGEISLTIDDGPDPAVTPQVLDLLDQAGIKASFFCIAERVVQHPALAREILARGHDLQNHSAVHRHNFSMLGPRGYADELSKAQRMIESVTGQRPRWFRAPAGFRNPFLDPVLSRLGLGLVSWTRRGFDTRDGSADRVLARLCRGLAAGDILLLHDGHAGRTPSGEPMILNVLPRLLERCRAAGLRPVRLCDALP